MWQRIFRDGFIVAGLSAVLAFPGMAAQGDDPDWPCIQRKVPQLSLGQIWNGPELPKLAAAETIDADAVTLVRELAARRVPLAEAQQKIVNFAKSIPAEQRDQHLLALVEILFDHMNHERADVISGIARYAHRQAEMAENLRQEAAAVDALRSKPDADPDLLEQRNDQLVFRTRIYQERVQSLTFVCEVPTLIEQRLYSLAKTIADVMAGK